MEVQIEKKLKGWLTSPVAQFVIRILTQNSNQLQPHIS